MTTGGDYTYYDNILFRTEAEARWAVFLDQISHGDREYEPDGCWSAAISPVGSRPQLRVSGDDYVGEIYLEVREHWDPHTHQPKTRPSSQADEHCVYLAAGDLPTDEQMRTVGWWDADARRGVHTLAGIAWGDLFDPDDERVLAALTEARDATFELSLPGQRSASGPVQDIPEREREDDPGSPLG